MNTPLRDRPRQIAPSDPALLAVLTLIRRSFAYMDGVIDPPSSIHRLRLSDLRSPASEVWALGDPVLACMILTPHSDVLYLGKLAVAESARGRGLARVMVGAAVDCARILRLPAVELQTRVELTGNQAAFTAMGFVETGRSAHPGHVRPTSITYRLAVTP